MLDISKTLEKEEGGTVEAYRFVSVSDGVRVANVTDGEVITERTYSQEGARALESRLQTLGFRA